jgi:tricorn protease
MFRTLILSTVFSLLAFAQPPEGYYRYPALHGDTLVFTAEGDLWKVGVDGGVARRLTTHLEQETHATISPNGQTVAFVGRYEGPPEVYTIPLAGGLPQRHTWHGQVSWVVGWTPDGKILYSTRKYSTLPNYQLVALNPADNTHQIVPLTQADQGAYSANGGTLFFTRLAFQGSHAKRYKGGTAQNLWKFAGAGEEAVPLTADYTGTSKEAMWWNNRVYFLSDRDGTMNLWSMDETGGDLTQHTRHDGWDAASPSMHSGNVAYQLGADLRIVNVRNNRDRRVPIQIASDLDQMRQRWVDKPMSYLSNVHVAPKGDRVVLTARGELFVAPLKEGRLAEITRRQDVRYRDGRFLPDRKSLVAMSDESGEVEIWKLDATGRPEKEQLTSDGRVLRWEAVPSPDGKWVAHDNKDQQLWLVDVETKQNRMIAESSDGGFTGIQWSPDSEWLLWSETVKNRFIQLMLYNLESGQKTALTTDRFNSSGTWGAEGKWIYVLSDRSLRSTVRSPWGTRQPEPFFDKSQKIYQIPLQKDLRSPFLPDDEVYAEKQEKEKEEKDKEKKTGEEKSGEEQSADEKEDEDKDKADKVPEVEIDLDGIQARLQEVPAPAGNYRSLLAGKKFLYWISTENGGKPTLMRLAIKNEGDKPEKLAEDIRGYELTPNAKQLMIRRATDIVVIGAEKKLPKEAKELAKVKVNLKDWSFELEPREELRQMFDDAWRLHRDYFYDPNMHGVDWPAMRDKYKQLLPRVTDRAELSDLIAQMVSELSTLHTFVSGGDNRKGTDQVAPASLGALLARDDGAGGYRIEHIYEVDPDFPEKLSPLARPEASVQEGDVILAVNGVPALSEPDIGVLLRNRGGKQTRLRIRTATGEERDTIVKPMSQRQEEDLRYEEWEYSRRQNVDELGSGDIGYVHLRAMGSNGISQWARMFYPVFDRKGLIIDVRHNRGGNIDAWILGKLLRKEWFFWQPRVGNPYWNMHYAFRGHVVVLCNERTASDGEAFAEGFMRLGLGKTIGTRTWGGEIWLTSSNRLVDRGIATAAEFGVYADGKWLIEGHGVEPDIVVDNLPHATFNGEDAQLKAAVEHLQVLIREQPVEVPPHPPYPDKSIRTGNEQ